MLPRQDELLRTIACHVMVKPFDAEELLRAIGTALGPSPLQAASHADPSVAETSDYPLVAAAGAAL